jgi:hypothetical protein
MYFIQAATRFGVVAVARGIAEPGSRLYWCDPPRFPEVRFGFPRFRNGVVLVGPKELR